MCKKIIKIFSFLIYNKQISKKYIFVDIEIKNYFETVSKLF